jgi:hypothetical protein
MRTLTTETPITPGLDCYTMEMGRVVPVRVLEKTKDADGYWLGDEFRVRYTGTEKVCLDYGQNWYLNPGAVFLTRKGNMDRALEWIAEKY